MLKFTAFRTQKPRQFEYRPRYYDPEKEAREKRRRELLGPDAEEPTGKYVPGQFIRSEVAGRRGSVGARRTTSGRKQRGTMRLVIFLLLLFAAAWWLWLT